jgi:hypothetical protein
MNVYWVAAAWMGMALLASLISIRTGISVALVEIVVGAVAGNLPGHAHVVQLGSYVASDNRQGQPSTVGSYTGSEPPRPGRR